MSLTKKIIFLLAPTVIIFSIISTTVSCSSNGSSNMYIKNKADLNNLIEESKNEVKEAIKKAPKTMFDNNIDSPFAKEYDNNNWPRINKYWKAQELLDEEKLTLIFWNYFYNIKSQILKLDNDHKQIYEKVLELKYKILEKKGDILLKIEEWIIRSKN